MPIYEYECRSCGASVEQLKLSNDTSPKCCGASMNRVVSLPSHAVLKGAGFYATEFGGQPHNLGTTDQARRAQRECKEACLTPCRPKPTTRKQAQHIEDLERYGG